MIFFISLVIAACTLLFSLSKGTLQISLPQLLFSNNSILLKLRLPRTLAAFVTGGLLGVSGSLMQVLLQNPLADPYLLGIAGGAATITLLFMLLGINDNHLIIGSWLGSLFTIFLIFSLAKQHRFQTQSLLLIGIALAFGFSACISFILMISPHAPLHSMLFWLAGDLNVIGIPWLGMAVLIISLIFLIFLAPGLNILARGEKEAASLGLDTRRYRMLLYMISSLLTASAVTLAGCVGFIGLIMPHLTRKITGFDHRFMLPICALLSGSLLTLADTIARILFAPIQLPVGLIMTLIGVPVFIWLLRK